jgi:pilus assembly protein Flp/PilA
LPPYLSDFADFSVLASLIRSYLSATAAGGEGERMKNWSAMFRSFIKDDQGQDLIEYALMAGFVAVAAGAAMPNVSSSISTVFSKIQALLANAAG